MVSVNVKRQNQADRRRDETVPSVRVYPKNEAIRRVIHHQPSGLGFAKTVSESVEWPYDSFTKKRLREGDILLEPPIVESDAQAPAASAEPPPEPVAPEKPVTPPWT